MKDGTRVVDLIGRPGVITPCPVRAKGILKRVLTTLDMVWVKWDEPELEEHGGSYVQASGLSAADV
jgi:hypothetical protein